MKKVIFGSLLALVATIGVVSCEKEEVYKNQDSVESESISKKFDFIGEEHNKGLDQIFNEVKKQKKLDKSFIRNEKKLNDLAVNTLKKYYSKNESLVVNNYTEKLITDCFNKADLSHLKSSEDEISLEDVYSKLSEDCISILEELNLISLNNESDIDVLIDQIIILENNALDVLEDEKELQLFLASTSVAKSTLTYWSENLDKWIELFGENQAHDKADPYYKTIAKSDVRGAIVGAGAAVYANVVIGAGQVAYGTAIAGASAGFSAEAAIEIFIDWLW
jgi:hypothetical protein